jgi:ketosteroid isomerase-like protein
MSARSTERHAHVVLLDRIIAAAEAGDPTALFDIYAPDAVIWHNQQHVLRGTNRASGEPVALHACVVVQVGDDGRITRLDEYIDSAEAAIFSAR